MIYFIDFENTHKLPPFIFFKKEDIIIVFVGHQQTTMNIDDVEILAHSLNAKIIRVEETGNNNVDFHICYYIGVYMTIQKDSFAVISNDKGFDPLIRHLNKNKINCKRLSFPISTPTNNSISTPAIVTNTQNEDKKLIKDVIKSFEEIPIRNRPRKVKTLKNFIKTQLLPKNKQNNNLLLDKVFATIQSLRIIKVNNQNIEYIDSKSV